VASTQGWGTFPFRGRGVRNQQVASKLGVMNVSVETELQLQLQALSKALQSGQV